VKKSKLEGVAFHIRHTAASHIVMSGSPLATAKEILRHKDYATTLRYAHLSSEHTRAAMNALGASLVVIAKDKSKTLNYPH
jgi:site-specific recombinase XerD